MPALRTTLPWFLLTVSFALNLHLWRAHSSDSAHGLPRTHSSPPASSASSSATPIASFASSRDTPPSLNSQPSALHSTASRSSALREYAELLAEEVETPEQLTALHQLLARWVATAPTDAATWLAQHDDAPFYDPAALHVAKHLVSHERFSEATSWAELIRDPAHREDALDAIVAESFRAKKIDATAVRASGLPSNRIEAILNGSRLD